MALGSVSALRRPTDLDPDSSGVICYWGDTLARVGFPAVPITDCNSFCLGDYSQTCGAESLVQVYSSDKQDAALVPSEVTVPGQVVQNVVASSSTWTYQGCYPYGFDGSMGNYDQKVSVEGCAEFCQTMGAPAFSLRYGQHCYCGVMNYCSPLFCDAQCQAPCVANPLEACGADYFSLVYGLDAPGGTPT